MDQPKNSPLRVGVIGATGAVGRELLPLFEARDFPVGSLRLFASAKTPGRTLTFQREELPVVPCTAESLEEDFDLLFFCADSETSREFAPGAVSRGAIVVDNSSAFRMAGGVPLVVPEVNGAILDPLPRPGSGQGALIANPNCSTILMVLAVHPLLSLGEIRRITLSTYQAVSGAGTRAMDELHRQTGEILRGDSPTLEVFHEPCAFNVFSHDTPIGEDGLNTEERKIVLEARKIWSRPRLRISPTCIRVPVPRAHAESLTLEFDRDIEREHALAALKTAPGVRIVDNWQTNEFPTPRRASHRDDVDVGRIRRDPEDPNLLSLFLCGDQLRKGAALNALQIAERLL